MTGETFAPLLCASVKSGEGGGSLALAQVVGDRSAELSLT